MVVLWLQTTNFYRLPSVISVANSKRAQCEATIQIYRYILHVDTENDAHAWHTALCFSG